MSVSGLAIKSKRMRSADAGAARCLSGVRRWQTAWLRLSSDARKRFHDDLALAIICLGGFLAASFITPFAFYRVLTGEYLMAAIDLTISGCVASVSAYAWYTGRTRWPGIALVLSSALACIVVAWLLGLNGAMWSYAVIVMNFFLLPRRAAMLASIGLIVAVAVTASIGIAASRLDLFTYAVTGILVSIYSSIFASRTSSQRRRLEELASRDALTGVGNRRLMETDLAAAALSWRPGNPPGAVVILDLDHFKLVNDRYGHEAGDHVLIRFADIVRQSLRCNDRLYRYGGEEFVLLLPGLDSIGLVTVLTKLRQRIKQQLNGPGGPVTASMGVAQLRQGDDWTSWLSRADGALYAAKREGRDRIVIDGVAEAIAGPVEIEG